MSLDTTAPEVIINVDDNEPSRYAKGRILSYAGFQVHNARSGADALELAAKHTPDLVLLDVNLPDINGIEVCRRLKSSANTASILVLQISASATAAPQATVALNSGADAYVMEPVDPDVLVATVRALLRLRRAERALAAANDRLLAVNSELQRSNEDLQQFAFVASHDLQEPLRTVISFSGLLTRSLSSRLTGTEREYLEFIQQGAHRMRALIKDLLDYSQIGRLKTVSAVNLNQVVEGILLDLQLAAKENSATIVVENLPTVDGDEAQLVHLLQNLLSNAIKYRKPEVAPMIHVRAERGNHQWTIQVQDNGIGIDPKYREIVFAPFRRLHGHEIAGTGIGLAVCRRVVESHGGQIWVDSIPGEGSTFSFTLPFSQPVSA